MREHTDIEYEDVAGTIVGQRGGEVNWFETLALARIALDDTSLEKGSTPYNYMRDTFNDMTEAGYLEKDKDGNTNRYRITDLGKQLVRDEEGDLPEQDTSETPESSEESEIESGAEEASSEASESEESESEAPEKDEIDSILEDSGAAEDDYSDITEETSGNGSARQTGNPLSMLPSEEIDDDELRGKVAEAVKDYEYRTGTDETSGSFVIEVEDKDYVVEISVQRDMVENEIVERLPDGKINATKTVLNAARAYLRENDQDTFTSSDVEAKLSEIGVGVSGEPTLNDIYRPTFRRKFYDLRQSDDIVSVNRGEYALMEDRMVTEESENEDESEDE